MQLKNILTRIIQVGIFAVVVLVPLAIWRQGMYPFLLFKTVLFQAVVEIIFAAWLALAVFCPEYRPRRSWIFWTLSALVIAITLSGAFGADRRVSFWSNEARTLGIVAIWHFYAFYLVLSGMRRFINWRALLLSSFAVSAVVSLVSPFQHYLSKSQFVTDNFFIPGSWDRPWATFGNPTFLAGYLLFNIAIGAWLIATGIAAAGAKKFFSSPKILFFAALGMDLWALILTQTVGDLLGLAAGVFTVLLFFAFKKENPVLRRAAIGLITAGAVFAGIFYFTRAASFWQEVPGLRRAAVISADSPRIQFRLVAWRNALKGFAERPVLGWGWENFNLAFNKRYDPVLLTTNFSETYWDKPHNVFLEYLITTGAIGFLAYISVFVAVFYEIRKIYRRNKAETLFTALVSGALVAYLVQNLVVFDTIGTYLMFVLFLAWIDRKESEAGLPDAGRLVSRQPLAKWQYVLAPVLLVPALVGAYYNIQILNASRYEWQGVNNFINNLLDNSLATFEKAVTIPTPYRDDIMTDFATTVKQGRQQSQIYPGLQELQERLIPELEAIIRRHPQNYFNYLVLADFKNVMAEFNPVYPKEAEELARKALELSPRRQQIYYSIAKSHLIREDYQGAFAAFDEAVRLNPEAGDPHFFYGLLAYQVGDFKKGREEIALAEKYGREPQEIPEAVLLANFKGDADRDYQAAVRYLDIALDMARKLSKDSRDIELKLAVSYYLGGKKDAAREAFEALGRRVNYRELNIYPNLAPVLNELDVKH